MRYLSYLIIIASLLISCSPNNVKKDNSLKKFFDENKTDGTFALLDNGTGKFTVYNLSRYRDSAYVPASTFKIINSLIGLQTGAISSDSMVIKWDGIKRRDTWDKDLNMFEAFRASAVPYYQEVARRIGKDTMQAWLNRLGYGAKSDTDKVVITSAIDTFWLDNSVTVTPDQQLGIMKELYFNRLPGFFRSHQEIVKNAMLFENNTNYQLGYKTGGSGWDSVKGRYIAWVVGWIKENNHPYFFVLNFETKERNADIPAMRMNMLKGILKHLGFFEGKM